MYKPFDEEPKLIRFVLVSLILHGLLFIALPNLGSLLEADIPGMAGGGIIQVMHVETSVNPRMSPVTDRFSQSTIPKVTEPKPIPDSESEDNPIAQPKIPEVPQPTVEHSRPKEVEDDLEESEVVEKPLEESKEEDQNVESVGTGDVITDPDGPEVVIESQEKEETTPSQEEKEEEQDSQADVQTTHENSSGSGTGIDGSDDTSGTTQSGEGTAESAPPLPAPPPSGHSLHIGGGNPLYPKNAEHDGVEGTVLLVLHVSASGELRNVIISKSSGDERLDNQAERYIKEMWSLRQMPYDYSLDIGVVFTKEENRFRSSITYGDVNWMNVP